MEGASEGMVSVTEVLRLQPTAMAKLFGDYSGDHIKVDFFKLDFWQMFEF